MRLHVNVDHVATLRNARGTPYPDPVEAARVCLDAGADGITAHLREDRRHIVDDDVKRLRALLRDAKRTFNLEMAATAEMVDIARAVAPDVVTLVPERRQERTTEGGLDVVGGGATLAAHVASLRDARIKVSLFIAADAEQVAASRALGAQQIELHTGEYAHAFTEPPAAGAAARELLRLEASAKHGHDLGLEIAAGHGLTRDNVVALAKVRAVVELNIGHAMIADAVFLSMRGSVEAMREAIARGRS